MRYKTSSNPNAVDRCVATEDTADAKRRTYHHGFAPMEWTLPLASLISLCTGSGTASSQGLSPVSASQSFLGTREHTPCRQALDAAPTEVLQLFHRLFCNPEAGG